MAWVRLSKFYIASYKFIFLLIFKTNTNVIWMSCICEMTTKGEKYRILGSILNVPKKICVDFENRKKNKGTKLKK